MTGLTQAYRPDGTSEGDIQALRPGRVRIIDLSNIDPENPDHPIEYVPTPGTGLIQIKITDTDKDVCFYAVPAGESFFIETWEDEELISFDSSVCDLISPGERLTYALADGFKIGFQSAWGGKVRIVEGV